MEVADAEAAAASDDVEPKEKLEEAFKLLDEVEEAWLPKETVVCFFRPVGRPGSCLGRVLCLKRCESERSLKNLCWVVWSPCFRVIWPVVFLGGWFFKGYKLNSGVRLRLSSSQAISGLDPPNCRPAFVASCCFRVHRATLKHHLNCLLYVVVLPCSGPKKLQHVTSNIPWFSDWVAEHFTGKPFLCGLKTLVSHRGSFKPFDWIPLNSQNIGLV